MDRNTLQYVSCTMHGLHYCLQYVYNTHIHIDRNTLQYVCNTHIHIDRNTLQYVSCTMHGLHYCLHLLSAFGLHYCLHLLSADNLQTMQTIKQTMQSAMAFIIVFIIGLSALLSALFAEQTKPSLLAIPWCNDEGHPWPSLLSAFIVCILCEFGLLVGICVWRKHVNTQRRSQPCKDVCKRI